MHQFETTPKIPIYSFFLCLGDLKAIEYKNTNEKYINFF